MNERSFIKGYSITMTEFAPSAIVILEVAEKLILEKGYSATSMRDIASAAGYKSVAGLYNHFPDKESIFKSLLEYRSPYPEIIRLVGATQGETTAEFVDTVFRNMTDYMRRHLSFVQLAMIDYLEFEAVHIHALITDLQNQIVGLFSRLMSLEGVHQGLPSPVIMRFMAMQIFGFVMTGNVMPPFLLGTLSEEEWKTHMVKLILYGLDRELSDDQS
ncbi:MAG: TetR/AcrR family transcriptional regulator [Anaerolineae bacterium]|nr:MAG: TetR/AcrR family transcriptional regulator [Anaerolineae bacterium]